MIVRRRSRRWIEHYLCSSVVVAAAGNSASPRPCYPAALRTSSASGRSTAPGRAWFSNYGGWVDACAPGVDVVSTFFSGVTDKVNDLTREFEGWATWSGTSFSAPKVAAAIAQEMYLSGGTSHSAWHRLSDWKKFRYPDLGIVFNIA